MPYPRPVSPLSLEVLSPSASDPDVDGAIGSDDELDASARAAKRRRIEKLAEAYLQGSQLFILSASLKGPFGKGWKNPWKKDRKWNAHLSYCRDTPQGSINNSEIAVVQETEPHERRDDAASQRNLHRPRPHAVELEFDPTSSYQCGKSLANQNSKYESSGDDARRRTSTTTLQRKSKRSLSHMIGAQDYTPIHREEHSWLKKARTRTGIRNLDPPTSPSRAVATRQLDVKDRREREVSLAKRSPLISRTHRSESIRADEAPLPTRSSSAQQRVSHSDSFVKSPSAINAGSSLHVTSSSHLPTFEYRRLRNAIAADNRRSKSPGVSDLDVDNINTAVAVEALKRRDPPVVVAEEPSVCNVGTDLAASEEQRQRSITDRDVSKGSKLKDSRSVSFLGANKPPSNTTSERFPSGQGVPGNPNLADFVTSLHSTALPGGNSDYDGDTSPEAQFSTQAAVLLAQRSFQNAIDSPELNSLSASKRNLPVNSPSSSTSHPQAITPFSQINARRSQPTAGDALQMMSTQCMIDAVTPFTFSTEKKQYRHVGTLSEAVTSSHKRRKGPDSAASSQRLHENSSSPPENRMGAESVTSWANSITRSIPDQYPDANDDGDYTELMGLPLTLTGTTPPTAQDAQNGGDSFNLSQAIADAGSWLRQSWDFTRDLRKSGTTGPPSSTAA
ncbi:hypothetical protein MPDQ_002860 [Monascus purpureus]|uniref:Uncharacterized protein n=1 Tax=Monascus purpureus TaxID=5098 RepID=A0A507QNX3_MONPU|nr:hypothetical protein MPDQ_002860 [Monascus purpureus]BDD62235.1 hypothetical protein MAP00_007213 [Monascus purpureus]